MTRFIVFAFLSFGPCALTLIERKVLDGHTIAKGRPGDIRENPSIDPGISNSP
jgi:hypothetical protein